MPHGRGNLGGLNQMAKRGPAIHHKDELSIGRHVTPRVKGKGGMKGSLETLGNDELPRDAKVAIDVGSFRKVPPMTPKLKGQ